MAGPEPAHPGLPARKTTGIARPPPRPARYVMVAVAASAALHLLGWAVPALAWLGLPLVWLATLFHELGHALAALLVGGGVDGLSLHPDGSGLAVTRTRGTPGVRAFVAAGGPLGPPIAGLLLFVSLAHRWLARGLLALLGALCLLALVLWVRDAFTLAFVAATALVLAGTAWRAGDRGLAIGTAFMAVQLSLAALARIGHLFSPGAMTSDGMLPSDTAQMAAALGLTHHVWAALIALLSLAVVAAGIGLSMRLRARPTA